MVAERDLVPLPDEMPHDVASTLPQSGPIALQGIRTKGGVTAGQHVCVNGAGGGTGVLAVQLAKAAGAEVTAVDNAAQAGLHAIPVDAYEDFLLHLLVSFPR